MSVSDSEGTAPIRVARKVMPSIREPRMIDIQISVVPALRLRGCLKAGMPLEIASTPVSAVVPLENARRIRKIDSACAPCSVSMAGGLGTMPSVPIAKRARPTTTVMYIITTKK